MIRIEEGLKNSLIVLEHLRNNSDLDNIYISIGTFTNCRECGLTFRVEDITHEYFTFCVYTHRNSDDIIINGKKGLISLCGDLPYKSDNKSDYIKIFSYNQHYECAEYLSKLILRAHTKTEKLIEG